METLVAASPPRISKRHQKSAMPQFLSCSRNAGEGSSLSRVPIARELGSPDGREQNMKSIGNEKEEKKRNDIWQLFEEAQQNILHLNKQRLLAIEELERAKKETNLLLDRIEQLEMKMTATARKGNRFHIIHICTEMSHVVSVGSLASYITGLSCALQRKGNLVEIILPKFTYFSLASLDYLVKLGKRPDVLHIHNWQTSVSLEQPEKVALCGLDPSALLRPDRLQDNNKPDLLNVLKGGVVYSNKVIIMSSVNTKDRIISALGHGLEPTLDIHNEELVIAPSGFDHMTWDSSSDKFLPQGYSAYDMKGKFVCKFVLQRHLGLEGASNIVVGCIYSGIPDDLDKIKKLGWMASSKGVQFVFMRYEQKPGMTTSFDIFQDEDKNVRFIDEYDEELSHLIISGSDIMLCPSLDDHLLQLKALKYGTTPIPVNSPDSRFSDFGSDSSKGCRFSQYINSAFGNMPLGQALDEIKNNPSEWKRRIKDGMGKDFSWESECAEVHISAYQVVKKL
ncbi:hypothetical protein OROHE_026588 [Orobanche hederae]